MLRGLLVLLAWVAVQGAASPISLEIRVFHGADEVTGETRVAVHRAGDRGEPIAQLSAREGRARASVPAGIYDAQAVREREGRVLNIRWAERLVVMPYPDEGGRHLEVVNFANGYGALQVSTAPGGMMPQVALYAAQDRSKPAAEPIGGDGYLLYVVPAGQYDIQVRSGGKPAWHPAIEVPLDRTRLWLIP